MFHFIGTTLLFRPLYNTLVLLLNISPMADAGVAIILLTLLIKFILSPFTRKAIKSQLEMRKLEPEINKLKEKYADNKQELNKKTFELYKIHKVNPFAGCLPLLIQIPILGTLYWVFTKGLDMNQVSSLYSFVHMPAHINIHFLGFIDLTAKKNLLFSILVAGAQYMQFAMLTPKPAPGVAGESMQDQMMKNMQSQMKYFLPVMIFLLAYFQVPVAVSLYWIVNNIYAVIQQKTLQKKYANVAVIQ